MSDLTYLIVKSKLLVGVLFDFAEFFEELLFFFLPATLRDRGGLVTIGELCQV